MTDEVWLVRHGETEWSRDGRHTSHTDVDLTDDGVLAAEQLRPRLADAPFDLVLVSPRTRARRTAELAGLDDARLEDDLVEWDYGEFEGRTTEEIREDIPGWTIWTHPCPGGESSEQVSARLDRVVSKVRAHGGRVLLVGHGHALRGLAARWIGEDVRDGAHLRLDTATVSVLADERATPVIWRWNG